MPEHPLNETYLDDLAARLPGTRRARNAVLDEIHDGLLEATARRVEQGILPDAAAHASVAEFGTPAEVATAFAGELVTRQARSTVWAFLVSGPFVGLWWLLLFAPKPAQRDLSGVVAAIPVLPFVGIAVLIGLTTLAATGRLGLRLATVSADRALLAVTGMVLVCLAGDLTMLAILAGRIAGAHNMFWSLALVAVAASITRVACGGHVLRRCRHTRDVLR